jgi:hypothetical protein
MIYYRTVNRADFIELQKEFADNLIDLLFTDRLWKEHLAIYQDIAKLTVRVLKPCENLVFFRSHIILEEIFNIVYEFSLNNNNTNYNLSLK